MFVASGALFKLHRIKSVHDNGQNSKSTVQTEKAVKSKKVSVVGGKSKKTAQQKVQNKIKTTKSNAPKTAAKKDMPDNGVWIKIVKHEHLLYVMKNKKTIDKFGVAVGRNRGNKQKSGDCRTPEGKFSVQSIHPAQGWSHDFHDGNGVIPNAYGPWFIRLKTGWSGIGIHGTHDPASIGKNVTEGCIRLKNENLRTLKEKYIRVGMPVIIEN